MNNIFLKDKNLLIEINLDKKISNTVGYLVNQRVDQKWFRRLSFPLREIDDTSKPSKLNVEIKLLISINSRQNN